MTDYVFPLTRRHFLGGLGASALSPAIPSAVVAQERAVLTLQAKPGTASLRPGAAVTPIWALQTPSPDGVLRFKRGDEIQVALENNLPVPLVLNWHGIDGAIGAEPLVARPPLAPGKTDRFTVPLRHAGTFMFDVRLLGDGQARPSPARALIVGESEPIQVDRDEVLLIEDWRLDDDGNATAPGADAKRAAPLYTINGKTSPDITAHVNERLRLRFINACQRNAIALKIENQMVRIMAIDGRPAEPFLARNGQLVLAPGTRIDAFIDATGAAGSISAILLHDGTQPRPVARLVISKDAAIQAAPLSIAAPLPSNGLPPQLDLKNAVRVELPLGASTGSPPGWVTPAAFSTGAAPVFRAKRARTIVIALANQAATPMVFHLHGHHFRLLDRLDDGWKPFWLDTLLIDAGQTQRVAFAAESAGPWLMEAMAIAWAAPRLVRWYSVE